MLRELLSRAEAVQEKDRKRAVALRKQVRISCCGNIDAGGRGTC